jgi:ABC-type xylose transport system substrate-binding protein
LAVTTGERPGATLRSEAVAAGDQDHQVRGAGPATVRGQVKALCSDCQILYSNADRKPDLQQNQADAALTNGAKVMVLDPVDSASAASIVSKAKAQTEMDQAITALGNNGFQDVCRPPTTAPRAARSRP